MFDVIWIMNIMPINNRLKKLACLFVCMMTSLAYADEVSDSPDVVEQVERVLEHEPDRLMDEVGLKNKVSLGSASPEAIRQFVQVVDIIRQKYAKVVDDDELLQDATAGMLAKLDSHAEFLDEQALQNLQQFTEGHMAHVGLTASFDDNLAQWVVIKVSEESSASNAGIQIGDYIHQIGDVKLSDSLEQNDVDQLLLGIAGTQVDVVLSKQGRLKKTHRLQRNDSQDSQISVQMYNGVAIVKLPVFTNGTRQELMDRLVTINEPVQAIILDVRNNPGGVLSSAIDIASLFMPNQAVATIAEKDVVTQTLSTSGNPIFDAMPVFVLQNRYSASAAEVLALALSKDEQTSIVGETSYGKGSIQSIIPLDKNAIKLTTAYYETLEGKSIDGVGISPDVTFDFSNDIWRSQLFALIEVKKLKNGMILVATNDY